ncbi:Putative nuclease HARBI1 [Eumeta japonica]|uniref:Nuclease HARBI1 n=1 Tax=Eumeta variegata TaxID=151549 RepID=A0A4C1TG72_EUMVA|nr:Putative nuclease HARBI1 [Eumeta japonica]
MTQVERQAARTIFASASSPFVGGDSGYPLEPYLMTPLPNQPEGTPKFRYNESLCKARNPIERLFGVLKATWRCLSQQRTLLYEPGFTGKIVNACAVLHNINLSEQNIEFDNEWLEAQVNNSAVLDTPSSTAKRVQDRIIANHFS